MNCTLEELAVLSLLRGNAKLTQRQIAAEVRKSDRTVKRIMAALQKKGYLERKNGKRNGYWEIEV